jgi:hypothetical protein
MLIDFDADGTDDAVMLGVSSAVDDRETETEGVAVGLGVALLVLDVVTSPENDLDAIEGVTSFDGDSLVDGVWCHQV